MAYIDTTYVDNALTSAVRLKLAPDSTVFDQLVAMAEARVNSALEHAGYQAPIVGTASNDVKLATYGVFLKLAYARAQLDPPDRDEWLLSLADAIREGTYPVVGVTPSPSAGVGGVLFTESDASIDDSVYQIFGPGFLRLP
jgi:hypothetical protein